MLSLYRTVSVRSLGKRWFRALLIIASIALGVATLVATRALTETMNRAGLQAGNPLAGAADLIVSDSAGGLLDLSLADELQKLQGVASANPRVFLKVKLPQLDNRSALVVGIDITRESVRGQPWTITWRENLGLDLAKVAKGKFDLSALQRAVSWDELFALGERRTVFAFLGKELRESLQSPNQVVRVRSKETGDDFKVIQVGTIDAAGPFAALGGNTLIVQLGPLNEVLGWGKKATRIDLVLKPGADRAEVRQVVHQALRGRAEVHTPDEKNAMIQNVFAGMQTGFSLCGLAALVVGLFLVYNVLAFSVAERRHEIGILRALGATRRHVEMLCAGEAAVLGLIGSLLGIPLGLGLAQLGLQPAQTVVRDIFMDLSAEHVDVSPQVILLALAAGVCTAVAAAMIPAMSASSENPAAAVRRIPPKHKPGFRVAQGAVIVGLFVVGLACVLLRHFLPGQIGTFGGMVFMMLGMLVATPLLAAALAAALQPLVRGLAGIEGRLAADNLVRSASRTGIVIAALAAGVSLVMLIAGTIRSNRETLAAWVERSISADLIVTSGSAVGAGSRSEAMEPSMGAALEAIDGVRRAVPLRSARVVFRENTQVYLLAVDAPLLAEMAEKKGRGNPLFAQLGRVRDAAIVSDNFAFLHRVKPGDTVTLSSGKGPVELRVIGMIEDYSWNRGSLFINRADYLRHWGDDKVEVFDVFLNDGADPQKVQERILKKLGAENALVVQTRAELKSHIEGMINRIYGIAYGQLFVVMCVAALGVVTALLISVLQRRREMGMLRAIGASQLQVVWSVLAEAALMGAIGTVIGLALGVPMEWYVLNIIMREEFGYTFDMYIPWQESLLIAAAAITLATAAGLGPALYAVRQRIPEAIAYE